MSHERMVPPGSSTTPLVDSHLATPADFSGSFLFAADHLDDFGQLVVSDIEPPAAASEEEVGAYSGGLPAPEWWLLDPRKDKLQVPYDEYGLVDDLALVKLVKTTISPDYIWTGQSDKHHLYWAARRYYEHQLNTGTRAFDFRELPNNQIRVPRIFHNWVHAITEQPVMPETEIMHYQLDAWAIASGFFKSVESTMRHHRLINRERLRRGGYDAEQESILTDLLAHDLSGVFRHLDKLNDIPQEHWPFSPHERSAIAAGRIGHIIKQGSQYRSKAVSQAA